MKTYLNSLLMAALAALAFTACTEEEGQAPGNDATPRVTLFQYDVPENYNPDNDLYFRIVANNKTEEVYYLVETVEEKEARGLSDDAYADYVVEHGTKADANVSDGSECVLITDLHGLFNIAIVAKSGSQKTMTTGSFAGLLYKPLCTGVYTSDFFGDQWDVDVEYSEIGNRYRIANNWVDGYSLVWTVDGEDVTCLPARTETGYVHSTYGMVYALDQGSKYDANTKTFTFGFRWQVVYNGGWAAFGNYDDTLELIPDLPTELD